MSDIHKIRTVSVAHRNGVIAAIIGVNPKFQWHRDTPDDFPKNADGSVDWVAFEKKYHQSTYPYVQVSISSKSISGSGCGSTFTTLDEVLTLISTPVKPTNVEVKLNDEYTAVVTKDTIVVGCQTFPISALTALNEAVNKLKA